MRSAPLNLNQLLNMIARLIASRGDRGTKGTARRGWGLNRQMRDVARRMRMLARLIRC